MSDTPIESEKSAEAGPVALDLSASSTEALEDAYRQFYRATCRAYVLWLLWFVVTQMLISRELGDLPAWGESLKAIWSALVSWLMAFWVLGPLQPAQTALRQTITKERQRKLCRLLDDSFASVWDLCVPFVLAAATVLGCVILRLGLTRW